MTGEEPGALITSKKSKPLQKFEEGREGQNTKRRGNGGVVSFEKMGIQSLGRKGIVKGTW